MCRRKLPTNWVVWQLTQFLAGWLEIQIFCAERSAGSLELRQLSRERVSMVSYWAKANVDALMHKTAK